MERVIPAKGSRKLQERAPLPVDPGRSIAIKRDVHEFEVDADCAEFARAFRDVVTDPESVFGLIRVKRPDDRLGLAFEPGERFQGCFSLERALTGWLARTPLAPLARPAERALSAGPALSVVRWLEDRLLSDYAEIEELSVGPERCRLRYRYLEGTPIAGSSEFIVEPAGAGRCRVTQIFEYQEVNGIALGTFQRFGLKFHDQVVHRQIEQAAARAGASAVAGTIPRAYAEL